jgi:thiol:disulfide interchange protein DsbA
MLIQINFSIANQLNGESMKIKTWFVLACLVTSSFLTMNCAGDNATHANQYDILENALPPIGDSDNVEIVEFFWYGCPHCYDLESPLTLWLDKQAKGIELVRVPAVPYETHPWADLAKVFYIAEQKQILDKVHTPIFKALHGSKKSSIPLGKFLVGLFAKHGVSQQEFVDAFNSFDILDKISEAEKLAKKYGVKSVPVIFVNGKYRLTSAKTGSYQNLVKVLDYLVNKEREALSP